jgi:hypothetical protein
MKSTVAVFVGAVLIMGAGCLSAPTLENRLEAYQVEREQCIAEKQAAYALSPLAEQGLAWDSSQEIQAEFRCSTVDLATKYYAEDPEGIIELCVRTERIGGYTSERGLGGSWSAVELERLHSTGSFLDVTMDEEQNVSVGEETLEIWRDLCAMSIENALKLESITQ